MKQIFLMLFCIFMLCACGTKRQYFTPTQTDGEVSANGKLKAKLVDWNLNSAKLSNDEIITRFEGEDLNFKLEEDYTLLAYQDGEFVVADNNGNLKIFDHSNTELYSHKFDASVLSVTLQDEDLALVLADNSIALANRALGTRFLHTLSPSFAQDNRSAAPVFIDSIIVYPTLDGKLVLVDRNSYQILRDVVISAETFFNNVIHLSVVGDKMIAATAKKIIAVSPSRTLYLEADIKDVALGNDSLFILSKDGNVIKTDFNLRKITERKFEFAIFTKASVYDGYLYAVEKTGYLIKSDLELENPLVFEFEDMTDKMSFMGNGRFYYSNKILDLL